MKRHKRDRSERAYSRGYVAGVRGHSANDCPSSVASIRGSWLGGWREGREQLATGFMDMHGRR